MQPQEYLLLIALGVGVGLFGTLIGAGGGFILVPILLLAYPSENPDTFTAVSLAVVFMNASSGSFAYSRMKRIDYKSAFLFCLATLPGAVLGALATQYIPRKVFALVFGVLLITACIYLVLFPTRRRSAPHPSHKGHTRRKIVDREGTVHEFAFDMRLGLAISGIVGFASSLLGIGGGIIHVPALTQLLNYPVHVATATSHLILAISALVGTITHIAMGDLQSQWLRALLIGLGAVAGAQIGAKLSTKVHGTGIIRALAVALGIVGIRIFLVGLK